MPAEPQGRWIRRAVADSAVVFVHGVLSSGETCWRSGDVYWPEILAQESVLSDIGIYVFSYRSDVFSAGYSLGDAVEALNAYLKLDQLLQLGNLIFVCHSMGGILVRQFLVTRQAALIEKGTKIGLFLVASPSLGSDYANLLLALAKALGNLQAEALRFANNNAWLNDLDRNFINLKESGHLAICGQELVEDQFVILPSFFQKQVVRPFSGAKYFGESVKIPYSDHFTIAKPSGPKDLQHRLLVQFIANFVQNSGAKTPSSDEQFVPPGQLDLTTPKPRVLDAGIPTHPVLIIFANPRGTSTLRLGEEDRAITESIRLSKQRESFSLTKCHAATVHDLSRALLDHEFRIVHISGHGTRSGLVLEEDDGRRFDVPQEALAKTFAAHASPAGRLECVILNSCYSLSTGSLASLGVPYTIAMEGPISDRAAIEFSRGFYDALGAGKDIPFAYEEGCRRVELASPGSRFASRLLRLGESLRARTDFLVQNDVGAGQRFVGRMDDLEMLDQAWNNPEAGVFSLIAAGGVGKTSLAKEWQLRLKSRLPYTRIGFWSFYAQGSEGGSQGDTEAFFSKAFDSWFKIPRPNSRWEQGQVIAQQIRDSGMAIVLDGLEPTQRANDPNLGAFLDERLIALFQELALPGNGLCVCTSRVKLVDLTTQLGHGHLSKELENLSPKEGAALFRLYGIGGTQEQLEKASESLGNHALALTLAARYIAEYYLSDPHIHKLDSIPALTSMQFDKESRHARRILRYYEDGLLPDSLELALLKCLGLFDRPAEPGALEILWSPEPIEGLSESLSGLSHDEILRAVEKLRRLGLVNSSFSFHEISKPLDCHPIIRAHFAEVLRTDLRAWRTANLRLSRYYASRPSVERPKTIEEMQHLYPAVVHACRANEFAEAWDIYWRRIQQGYPIFFNTNTLCAFNEGLAALNAFYSREWKGVLPGVEGALSESDYLQLLTEVGFHLKVLGRFDEAKLVIRSAMDIFAEKGRFREAAINAENLSESDLLNGNLRAALTSVAVGRDGQSFADRSGDPFRRLQTLALRGQIHLYMGNLDLAKADLMKSEELRVEFCSARQPVRSLYILDYFAETGEFDRLKHVAELFRPLLNEVSAKPFTGAFNLFIGQGRAFQAIRTGEPVFAEEALELLELAVQLLEAAELPHLKPWARCVRAKVWVFLGNKDRAKNDLETAMNIARYSRLRLFEVDCHLGFCNYYLAFGDTKLARQHLEAARPAVERGNYRRPRAWMEAMDNKLNGFDEEESVRNRH